MQSSYTCNLIKRPVAAYAMFLLQYTTTRGKLRIKHRFYIDHDDTRVPIARKIEWTGMNTGRIFNTRR